MDFPIPAEVAAVSREIRNQGFEAYLVGGCVRDLLLGRTPKDWDVTTNAKPEDIQQMFPHTFYENTFGTVGVSTESENESTKIVEVTPYRTESSYSDKRRPDAVSFGDNLEEDLARRDFTINAMALNEDKGQIIDPFKGQKDIELKVLRTVGVAEERFEEDALRLLRAIRLIAELDFALDADTATAIAQKAPNLLHISQERIRDEFIRMINSKQPMMALTLSQQLGVLSYISKDLGAGIGIDQNQAHSYDVFGHLMRAVQHAADKDWSFDIRLSALFHDIGKPATRRWSEEKNDWTFYGHDVVGAKMTKKALENLRFSRETIQKVTKLVRWHMFFSDPDQVSLAGVRRMIRNVGEENIDDLLQLRICDRIGTGRPKEQPFRFRMYKAMIEEALRDPISVTMLKTDGNRLMKEFHVQPGPRIGWILNSLLEDVLDNPTNNTEAYLDEKTAILMKL
jgi:tRNA nucleotidyltransferase (CCA-adding enzyme)